METLIRCVDEDLPRQILVDFIALKPPLPAVEIHRAAQPRTTIAAACVPDRRIDEHGVPGVGIHCHFTGQWRTTLRPLRPLRAEMRAWHEASRSGLFWSCHRDTKWC